MKIIILCAAAQPICIKRGMVRITPEQFTRFRPADSPGSPFVSRNADSGWLWSGLFNMNKLECGDYIVAEVVRRWNRRCLCLLPLIQIQRVQ